MSFGSLNSLLIVGVLLTFAWRAWCYVQEGKRNPLRLPNPPGPRPLPIIGNALDVPSGKQWVTYDQWSKQYGIFIPLPHLNMLTDGTGDITSFTVFGQTIVILGSWQRCLDLFEKRSSIYSDRPRLIMLHELYYHIRLEARCCYSNVSQNGMGLEFRNTAVWRLVETPSPSLSHIFPSISIVGVCPIARRGDFEAVGPVPEDS